jgi:hypothetical protein
MFLPAAPHDIAAPHHPVGFKAQGITPQTPSVHFRSSFTGKIISNTQHLASWLNLWYTAGFQDEDGRACLH